MAIVTTTNNKRIPKLGTDERKATRKIAKALRLMKEAHRDLDDARDLLADAGYPPAEGVRRHVTDAILKLIDVDIMTAKLRVGSAA